jgi:hypothetical protein
MGTLWTVIGSAFARLLLTALVTADGVSAGFGFAFVRWGDIKSIRGGWPFFHVVSAGLFSLNFVVMPRRWLLSRSEDLDEAIDGYAPAGNPIRMLMRADQASAEAAGE